MSLSRLTSKKQAPSAKQSLASAGEAQAAAYLAQQGAVCLAKNWHCGRSKGLQGELDWVGWGPPVISTEPLPLWVVEVKTRSQRLDETLEAAFIRCAEAITPAKQQQVAQLAEVFVAEKLPGVEVPLRLMALLVVQQQEQQPQTQQAKTWSWAFRQLLLD